MAEKLKILIVSQYFYPENFRINEIATDLRNMGHEITVLTGIPNYPKGKFFQGYGLFKKRVDYYNGVKIFRLPILSRRNNKIMLILNYLSFVISGFFWSRFTKNEFDMVYIYETSPIFQALPGIWYAKRRKIPTILYVTDLWPESIEFALNIKPGFFLKVLHKITDYIYFNSNLILVCSRGFIEPILKRNVNKDLIHYWPQYAEEKYKIVNNSKFLDDYFKGIEPFTISFTGNIGYAQGLNTLIQTAIILKGEKLKVRFRIVGDGRYKLILQKLIAENSLFEYFDLHSNVPSSNIYQFFERTNVVFLSLSKKDLFKYSLPSKTQTYFASAIPILASADGEIEKLIISSKAGFCSPSEDAPSLVTNIKKFMNFKLNDYDIMKKDIQSYSQTIFEKKSLLNKLNEYFIYLKKMAIR
jgi:glycosyltransferase involved in cell wall biosynthesis